MTEGIEDSGGGERGRGHCREKLKENLDVFDHWFSKSFHTSIGSEWNDKVTWALNITDGSLAHKAHTVSLHGLLLTWRIRYHHSVKTSWDIALRTHDITQQINCSRDIFSRHFVEKFKGHKLFHYISSSFSTAQYFDLQLCKFTNCGIKKLLLFLFLFFFFFFLFY